ncbi:MAG: tyrosine-type recombinase/integrase [Oceanospirillales bacterium]|nr:tyrosine-type recombinase/integrase [Oceanospirillales bacterium]
MKRSLSDAKVKNLKPKDKPYKVTDGGGLYVYIAKSGTKSFRYDAKLNDKRFTITFGTYPSTSLADARNQHEQAHSMISKGIDPRTAAVEIETNRFSYYAVEQMKTLDLRDATYGKRIGRMQKYLFPTLDKKDVTEITALDVLQLLQPIAESGKRETSQRLAIYCRQTFDYMLGLQLIENNPAESVRRLLPKPKRSTNFAHLTQVSDLMLFLKALDSHTGDYAVNLALRFMPLVFLRPHNIRYLRWEYVDFDNKLITYPPEQMKMNKEHKVPLAKQALAILTDMKRLTGKHEYVFMSSRSINSNRQPMTENTLNVAITRLINPETGKAFGRGFLTSHGIRHTASTQLNELGLNADAIELQLAHAPRDRVRAVYNKAEYMPERIKMMQEWADYLDGLKN